MTGSYTTIREEEFVEFLNDIAAFDRVSTGRDTREEVYDLPLPADRLSIRVFSSIDSRTGVSRACGADAIRCVVWNHDIEEPVGGRVRTHRISTWKENLSDKITSLYSQWRKYDQRCPDCGGCLVLRDGKHGEFHGCVNYPSCDHTENISVTG